LGPLVWIGLAVLLVVVAALTGIAPKGGKPVARTRLMGSARLFLVGGIVVCAALGLSAVVHH
jgi:hypothetical protein